MHAILLARPGPTRADLDCDIAGTVRERVVQQLRRMRGKQQATMQALHVAWVPRQKAPAVPGYKPVTAG